MAEYRNMAICDLRNITVESAAEIEGISSVVVLVYPKDPAPELAAAIAKIPVKNVLHTAYLDKEKTIKQINGSSEVTNSDFADGGILFCNGMMVFHDIAPETEGYLFCNGMAIFQKAMQKNSKLSILAINGQRLYADFEEHRYYEEKIMVDSDMLELMEEKTLILSEENIILAPQITMELLKEKKPYFITEEKVVCNKEISAYVKLNSVAQEGIKIRNNEEWDEEDDD